MVRDTWLELRESITAVVGPSALNGPVDESGLAAFRAVTGYDIHPDLLELYRVNDGESERLDYGFFVFGGHLLSAQWAAETQRELREVYEEEPEASADAKILLGYPYPQITPFLTDTCGNYIGIDNAPGPEGRSGQICTYGADLGYGEISVIFSSLEELLRFLIKQMETANYEVFVHENGQRYLLLHRDEHTRHLTTVIGSAPENVVF